MSCDSGSVASWASGIGIDPCIGQAYCNANGSLPQSLDALNTWGLATGYKSSAGKWNCTPSPNPGTGQPPVTGGATPTSGGGSTSSIMTWIQANPILLAGGLVGAVLLLKK